jgi:hypothetical protein
MILAQDLAQWRAVVSAVIQVNILVLYSRLIGCVTKDSTHFVCRMQLWRA